jgi:hypothetical protein
MNSEFIKKEILKMAKNTKGADLKTVKKILETEKIDILVFSSLLIKKGM